MKQRVPIGRVLSANRCTSEPTRPLCPWERRFSKSSANTGTTSISTAAAFSRKPQLSTVTRGSKHHV
ncbi:unnamed protein product [Vitrella brassicaformis CCMP3155]|uniref:Uncharacterized protein n=1 Tax=Vitrella brassicaformis (strain CCMP3155) TaxID=1169540 RepID=A0A0G4H0P7_VITBC|nr:unnamed protein product [Vitrella brassicaformis CCMP3155]|eukprot:CEM37129.1 unnamed protein product [Vitrella brassicaformis CCMP3155]